MHELRDPISGRLVPKLTDQQELSMCQRYLEINSQNKVASEFGVNQSTVQRILRRHGVASRSYRRLDSGELAELLALWKANESIDSVAAKLNIPTDSIYRIAREHLGAARDMRSTRHYELNEEAFDAISEESAYWVGFLMADGCVSDPANGRCPTLALSLAQRDMHHVVRFREFLGSTHPVAIRKNNRSKAGSQDLACFSVTSRRLVARLNSFGVVPRKSKGAQVMQLEDDRHFWRGLVDGDGHVCLFKKGTSHSPVVGLTASKSLADQFADYVFSHTGKRPGMSQQGNIWHARCTYRNAEAIADLLYSGSSVFLERKQEIVRAILERRDRIRRVRA